MFDRTNSTMVCKSDIDSVLSTGTSYAPSIAATTTYYVGCKDNTTTCETATNSRQAVVGTVNPIPSAPSSSNVTNGAVCGSGVVNLTATCSQVKQYNGMQVRVRQVY
jgi:hypothetical protein